jgi:hypothetical protein
LLQIFTALSSRIEEGATLVIPFIRTKLNEKGQVTDPQTFASLQSLLQTFLAGVEKQLRDPDLMY